MNIAKRLKKMIEDLKNKEYRDAFVAEHIDTGIPFQIRALREQKGREWTQEGLGIRTGMAQETISRLEDPNYGKLTLKTLKRLASAFDVGLMVRFVPFSELVGWELNLTGGSLEVLSFDKDSYSQGKNEELDISKDETTITADRKRYATIFTQGTSDNVIRIDFSSKRTTISTSQNASDVVGWR
jgi:transcriptional regulator with XRE-family HTH domain